MTAGKSILAEPPPHSAGRVASSQLLRLIVVIISLLACLWGVWNSGREGLSQLLASYGAAAHRLDAADRAVQVGGSLPEAHYVRAGLLSDMGARGAALEEYERAASLRPHDYALWLELGRARDQAGDTEGAIAAFREAARLAPFYAAPRWQLGNTLYRAGRLDEAFAELRGAVASNPVLMPQALELAWAASGGDAQMMAQALQPQTPSLHLALARFFVKHGRTLDAIKEFRAAGGASAEERRTLLAELLAAKSFAEAYEVWSSGHPSEAKGDTSVNASANASVINGGFEETVTLNDPGFGWQLPPESTPAVQAAQDIAEPRSGARSLRLVWNGKSDAGAIILSQLVLVEPNTRYQLHFAARTEKLETGGIPALMVTDAGSNEAQTLGRTVALPLGTSPWLDYNIEFTTTSTTGAVKIIVRRQSCGNPVCPIFGRAWLDEFLLRRL